MRGSVLDHVSASNDRQSVDAFHRAALGAGARDNGAPALRPNYHANYYGAFVLDPDGYNIEAVCHQSESLETLERPTLTPLSNARDSLRRLLDVVAIVLDEIADALPLRAGVGAGILDGASKAHVVTNGILAGRVSFQILDVGPLDLEVS